ncbi:hypothetical protein B5C34_12465 [Pacificimonas flava]|uniref:DUF4157 domain-containing protein n=2 Tax=Pacificimonas TaxID=1960290 RepID=A0A219B8U8_9SPHN|nr:hypothetical protein B5C34_12465 [Pacificimonas flava]
MTASTPFTADAFTRVAESHADHRAPDGQGDQYARFFDKYVEWARTIEAEGQERGTRLTPGQVELGRQIGIEHPERVRLVFVDAVPFPAHDEEMRRIGESLGFIGPGVTNNAQAFGYTVWVRNGFALDRPSLAHELVHVAQIERSESFGAYVRQYMMELIEHGHLDMPLEVEAYEANREYE